MSILPIFVLLSVVTKSRDPFDKKAWILIPQNYTEYDIHAEASNLVANIFTVAWEAQFCAAPEIGAVYVEAIFECPYLKIAPYHKQIISAEDGFTKWEPDLHDAMEKSCEEMTADLTANLQKIASDFFRDMKP